MGFGSFQLCAVFDIRVNIKMRLLDNTSVKVNENDWIDLKYFFQSGMTLKNVSSFYLIQYSHHLTALNFKFNKLNIY